MNTYEDDVPIYKDPMKLRPDKAEAAKSRPLFNSGCATGPGSAYQAPIGPLGWLVSLGILRLISVARGVTDGPW